MKRYSNLQIESLEHRTMMDAAGIHALAEGLVAPHAISEVAEITDESANTNAVHQSDNEWRYVPVRRIASDNADLNDLATESDTVFGGWGASSYQYAYPSSSLGGHELGDVWSTPTHAGDDVVVDGKIITAENYDSAAAPGGHVKVFDGSNLD